MAVKSDTDGPRVTSEKLAIYSQAGKLKSGKESPRED